MDYSLPIARRTRRGQALIYKELFERKRRSGGDSASVSGLGGENREGSAEDGARVGGSEKLGFGGSVESDSVAFCDGCDEVEVEEIGVNGGDKEEGVDSVDSVGLKSSGSEKIENVVSTGVDDDSEDDEVEVIGELGGFGLVHSNCSSLKTGSGSKVGSDKGEDFVHIDVDEVVSLSQLMGENSNFNSNGVGSRTRSQLGVSKESEDVSDVQSIDSDDESESSSEEDNDDSEDDDYRMDNLRRSGSLEQSSSSSEEEEEGEDIDDTSVMKMGRVDGEGKEGRVEDGLEKKKVHGLDMLVDSDNDKDKDNPVSCVAQRTRSRFDSKSKKKKLKSGTVSRPICVDEEELDSSSGHDDDDDDDDDGVDDDSDNETYHIDQNTGFNNGNDDECARKVGGKDEGELGKPTKRKRIRAPKDYDVLKILVDSIWEKGDVLLEELVSSRNDDPKQERNPSVVEISLPLKFTFGIEESELPEKSEYEKELDQLWAEFDFVLRSREIGSVNSSVIDNEDAISLEVETDRATLCRRGNHMLILDEQIGIRCKFCSFVKLEIRHILPSFSTHPWGKSDKKDSGKMDYSVFDALQFQDSGYDSQSGCDPCVHAKGTVWDIIPGVKNSMYPHQREGFEFIWNNIVGGIYLDELKKATNFDGGSGCIISHAPGTGKTRLTIVFLQTYMELFPTCRPVIIAPRSMLLTWEEEFHKWKVDIPFHNLNKPEFSGKENKAAVNFLKQVRHQDRSIKSIRMVKLYSWKKDRSILGISYRLFEKLAGERVVADGEDKKKGQVRRDTEGEQVRKILLELPGLLVLDEGHTPRNDQSLIWKALSKIETERRIILSGTPFQNNFGELYNTLCLVRPKFADRISSEHHRDFPRKRGLKRTVARGKWAYLTNSIGKHDDDRLEELRAMIDPFVHVHKGTILQESLLGLRDSVVVLQPADLQKSLLEGIHGIRNPLEQGYLVSLISVHPSLFPECLFEKEEFFVDKAMLEKLRLNPDAGVKTKFLMELIRLSEAMNEKVLVFSQYLDPLTLLRDQLKSHFNWKEGKELLYMDGQLDVKQRQSSITFFNDSTSQARVLLASTKACSEGINLVGASRVVLLDVVWNPSVERQAISRAYRLGQKKVVYIYHLITSGTIEGEKYYRQAEKDRLSELVFSSTDRDSDKQKVSSTVSEDKILEEMVQHDKLKCMFEKIIYQPKESNLIETFGLVDF